MSATSSLHKRSTTYEGDQMVFKFPSDEDLPLQKSEVKLTGPDVKPFHVYEQKLKEVPRLLPSNDLSAPDNVPLSNYQSSSIMSSPTFGIAPSEFGASSRMMRSEASSYFKQSTVGHTSYNSVSSVSIPTQDNISYQITSQSNLSQELVTIPGIKEENEESQYVPQHQSQLQHQLHQHTRSVSSAKKYPSIGRNSSIKGRKNSMIKRSNTLTRNEDESLYRRSSLKRSKAMRSNIGWLSRLKMLGITLKKNVKKSWRFISQKKVFKFKRLRTTRLKKNTISMPLERERAQSISELRREINEWYTVKDPKRITVDAPPSARYKLVDSPPSLPITKMPPPPVPEHRIASNPSIQRAIEAQEEQKRNSLFSPYAPSNQLEIVSISGPNSPDESKFLLDDNIPQIEEEDYPSNPRSIIDEATSNYDTDDTESLDSQDEEDEREMLHKYWSGYLRKVIAGRIESKLEMHKLSLSEEPEDMFSLISDTETLSDTASDRDSLSSISTSSYSVTGTESSFVTSSQVSTAYHSAYADGPIPVPEDILRYQQQFIERHRTVTVKRALTDSARMRSSASVPTNAHLVHARYMSTVI